jgi:RimJ/RimL family protein N-acetyltransferase
MYAIVECEDGKFCGVCGLTSINFINRRAEFSCYIAPEFQGHGLSVPTLKTLFRHGFEDLNLNLIWGEVFEGNHALAIFKHKLGMVWEGRRRQFYWKEGRFWDADIVSITADEFNIAHPVEMVENV